jgi:hypothetical protein
MEYPVVGLDIYLYAATDAAQNKAYDEASAALYEPGPDGKSPRDLMTEEQYKAWGEQYSYAPHGDVPSERYPEHLFNRRYLRSSYNGGGFNHAVPEMLGTSGGEAKYPNERGSLYWIFEPMSREWDGDEGALWPDDIPKLEECKKRALSIADELRSCDRLRVLTVSPNIFGQPPTFSDDDALRMYRAKVAEGQIRPDGWWESRDISVYGTEGVTILAAIPGRATFNVPGVHLIYRAAADGAESYIQSAEITAEFCDEAIALIQRDGTCSISWSG